MMIQGAEYGVLLNRRELHNTLVMPTEEVDAQPSGLSWRVFETMAHALDRLNHHMRWPSSAVAGANQVRGVVLADGVESSVGAKPVPASR